MLETTRVKGNAMIIHGGGLVEPSKWILLDFAKQLSEREIYSTIYLGRFSFESLYTPEFWVEYSEELEEELADKRGTWFGTCRGIFLTDTILFRRAIDCLKKKGVTTIIVAGGDGSARQCAETQEMFEKNGINLIFPLPLTVDGINGGRCVGIEQAIREIVRQTENVAATSLQTRDNGEFSVVIVETQGRNRDDLMGNVLDYFHCAGKVADVDIEDILLIAVPANMETDLEKLIAKVDYSKRRTLILISEGAKIKTAELEKRIKRKVRTHIVGHQVQSNGLMTEEDKELYAYWVKNLVDLIEEKPDESYSLATHKNSIVREELAYFAKLNPFKGQVAEISAELVEVIKHYMT